MAHNDTKTRFQVTKSLGRESNVKQAGPKYALLGGVFAAAMVLVGCKESKQETAQEAVQPSAPDNSPAVHSEISAQPPSDCRGGFWDIHYGDAYKTLREAEDYKPGARLYYVRELNDHRNEYLLAGISPSFRKEWLTSHQTSEKDYHCIVPLFDEIGAAAKRTLPIFRPSSYKLHDSAEESLIKDVVKERVPEAKFIDTAVKQTGWDIEILSNGVPRHRYKYGIAWVKSPQFDDGYCRIVHVMIYQEYSGGGTFGDSKASYVDMIPAGCK